MNREKKKIKNFHVFKYWMLSLKIEGFSCTLGVLYGGLGIRKLQILIIESGVGGRGQEVVQ
jgi:hypothetical protein